MPHSRHAPPRRSDTTAPPRRDPTDWSGPVGAAYEQALRASLYSVPSPVMLDCGPDDDFHLDVARYTAAPDETDEALLRRCTGPTLDIGCGPGRLTIALARRGVPALGVDVTPTAVILARAAGAAVLRRSVFDRIPGEGSWNHALLIDGNIGIGGDPEALLARVRTLLRPGGDVLVETAAHAVDQRISLRTAPGGDPIPWARLGTAALLRIAESLGFTATEVWRDETRHFVALRT